MRFTLVLLTIYLYEPVTCSEPGGGGGGGGGGGEGKTESYCRAQSTLSHGFIWNYTYLATWFG